MELTTKTKKIIISDGGHTMTHVIRRFQGTEYAKYNRRIMQSAKVKRGGDSVDSKQTEVQMKEWFERVESVEGYEHNGEDVFGKENWKDLVAQLAPEHCIIAMTQLVNVYASDDDGPDVNFQKDSSEDASDET